MANGEMKAKLVLQASAEGDEEIINLRSELDKTAGSADKAAPEFAELAAEINKLGEQRAAIAEFERLKTITTDTAARLQQFQQATREAALALKEKQAALVLSRSLRKAKAAYEGGEKDVETLKSIVTKEIQSEPMASIDYVDLFSFPALKPIATVDQESLLAIAVRIGKTRLIDNVILG